jgi:HAD superfamily hydrolase (TIGR01549 family)
VANNNVLAYIGHPALTFDEWLPGVKLTLQDFWGSIGMKDDWESVEGRLVRCYRQEIKEKTFYDHLYAKYKNFFESRVKEGNAPTAYPDAKPVLGRIFDSGRHIAVLSSHPHTTLEAEAERYGVRPYLETVVGSVKEKTGHLRALCDGLSVGCRQALYVGDTVYDVQSGRNAGVVTAAVATGYHLKERLAAEKPDILADSLTELADRIGV